MAKNHYIYRMSNVVTFNDEEKKELADAVRECLLVRNLSAKETQKELSITDEALRYIQKEFSIRKTRQQIVETMQRTNTAKFGTPYFDVADKGKMTKYRFQQLSEADRQNWLDKFNVAYKKQNQNIAEVCNQLNMSANAASYFISLIGCKTNEERAECVRRTSLNKYGVAWPTQSDAVKQKTMDTCLNKWGATCYLASSEARENYKQWSQAHYGVDHPFMSAEYQEGARKTRLERYGVEYTAQSKDLQSKMQATCVSRYGSPFYHSSEEGKLRMRVKWLNRYGNSDQTIATLLSADKLREFILSFPEDQRYLANLARELGCDVNTLHVYVHQRYGLSDLVHQHEGGYCHSYLEDEVFDFIHSMVDACRHYNKLIYPQEVDIFVPSCKLAIEVNGVYWHSAKFRPDKNYHRSKSDNVRVAGSRLYHIFEYEWKTPRTRNIIQSQLRNALGLSPDTLYARKCKLMYLSAADCRDFINHNHIQGFRNSSVYLGLLYEGKLVSVLTLGKPYFSNSAEWEIYRYCSLLNTVVVGGFAKLFTHFIRDYKPSTVLTYSDYAKGYGDVYGKNGFELVGTTPPNYVWATETDVKTRYQCQMKNERQCMESQGYLRIYDCGNTKWLWRSAEPTAD